MSEVGESSSQASFSRLEVLSMYLMFPAFFFLVGKVTSTASSLTRKALTPSQRRKARLSDSSLAGLRRDVHGIS